jgi:cellulose synthase (UDP-forming)
MDPRDPTHGRLRVEALHDVGARERESPRRQRLVRVVAIVAALVTTVYLLWRVAITITPATALLGIPLLAAELFALVTLLLFTYLLWDLDAVTLPTSHPAPTATVDAVIPTYSEPWEVLLPTVAAARAMQHVRTVWLLDDGDRPWVRALAADLGVEYRARVGSEDAKAGNINATLPEIDAEFVAILDADHVVDTAFVTRTIGHFDDPTVALVQTPQDFYNAGSFEHAGSDAHPFGDQNVFYRVVGPGRNNRGAVFWCGTNAIIRLTALRDVGGVATGTVTEDIHTSVRLQRRGWRLVYHNEILARGLAAADADQYFKQRVRWGTGTMQLVRSDDNPLTAAGLTRAQRLGYLSTILGWFDGWRTLILFLLPAAVLLTGRSPIDGPVLPFIVLFTLTLALQRAALSLLSRGLGPVIHTSLFETIRLPAMLKVNAALFTRSEPTFEVTHKGRSDAVPDGVRAPRLFVVLLAIFGLALLVFVFAISTGWPLTYASPLLAWTAVAWTLICAALVVGAILRITHSRFAGEQRAAVRFRGAGRAELNGVPTRVQDIALSGMRVETPHDAFPRGTRVNVVVGEVALQGIVRSQTVVSDGIDEVRLEFDNDDRHALARLALQLFQTGGTPQVEWAMPDAEGRPLQPAG